MVGKQSLKVKIVGYALMLMLGFGLLEAGSHLVYWAWDLGLSTMLGWHNQDAHLDVYERVDPDDSRNWLLRPGTDWTLGDLIDAKADRGATIGEQKLRQLESEYGLAADEVIMHINQHGFRGAELQQDNTGTRILALGDSCTFGTLLDGTQYPSIIQSQFEQQDMDVEVVNGGVEAYSPRNIMYRLPEYLELQPDIVTIYIGWNALYTNKFVNQNPLRIVRIFRILYAILFPDDTALHAKKSYDQHEEGSEYLRHLDFPFLNTVEEIGGSFEEAGSQVVLVTLPGLFLDDESPGPEAMEIGHLPSYTRNFYDLALVTKRYNQGLRELAQRRGWLVVDLAHWSRGALVPREKFFNDSVHLTEEGQARIGRYMAKKLRSLVSN